MPKFSTIKPGDKLWDVRRATGMAAFRGRWQCWPVDVISVNADDESAIVVWNSCNPQTRYGKRSLEKLRRSRPGEGKANG